MAALSSVCAVAARPQQRVAASRRPGEPGEGPRARLHARLAAGRWLLPRRPAAAGRPAVARLARL